MAPDVLGQLEVWLLTGSQELYGPETLRQVEAHARDVAAGLDAQPDVPVRVVYREVATSQGSIRRVALEANAADTCIGVIAWMHTFSPAKMWIAGLNALQKPLLHLHTQFNRELPWAEIDMDFMNLNQSAHGDREFGFIETRMGCAGRRSSATGRTRRCRRASASGRAPLPAGTRRSRCRSPASATTCARSRSPRATRSRRRSGSASPSTATASATSPTRSKPSPTPRSTVSWRSTRRHTTLAPSPARAAGSAASRCGTRRASRPGLRGVPRRRRLQGVHRHLRGPRRAHAAARHRRAAADGRRLRLRRRGRLEDGRARPDREGDGAGLDGGTSFMEDYTYHLAPAGPKVLGAHMLEVCPSIAAERPSCEIHPLSIGGKVGPGAARLHGGARPGGRRRDARPRRPLPVRR